MLTFEEPSAYVGKSPACSRQNLSVSHHVKRETNEKKNGEAYQEGWSREGGEKVVSNLSKAGAWRNDLRESSILMKRLQVQKRHSK